MPLSENEQQILREIEDDLSATDPKLVQQVTETTLYRHRARLIKWSAVGFVAGLLLMVFTFTTTLVLGVVGFVVMLGCALAIEQNVRKLGRAGPGSRALGADTWRQWVDHWDATLGRDGDDRAHWPRRGPARNGVRLKSSAATGLTDVVGCGAGIFELPGAPVAAGTSDR